MAQEIEQRAEAVREAGSEILKVRRQSKELEVDRDKALQRLLEIERETERACSLVVCEDGSKLKKVISILLITQVYGLTRAPLTYRAPFFPFHRHLFMIYSVFYQFLLADTIP